MSDKILDDLEERGLIHQSTLREELAERLQKGPIKLYCGFDIPPQSARAEARIWVVAHELSPDARGLFWISTHPLVVTP